MATETTVTRAELLEAFKALVERFTKALITSKAVPDKEWAEAAVSRERAIIAKAEGK